MILIIVTDEQKYSCHEIKMYLEKLCGDNCFCDC
jgi:hypothetical protein